MGAPKACSWVRLTSLPALGREAKKVYSARGDSIRTAELVNGPRTERTNQSGGGRPPATLQPSGHLRGVIATALGVGGRYLSEKHRRNGLGRPCSLVLAASSAAQRGGGEGCHIPHGSHPTAGSALAPRAKWVGLSELLLLPGKYSSIEIARCSHPRPFEASSFFPFPPLTHECRLHKRT